MSSIGKAPIDSSAIASAIKRYKGPPEFAPGQTTETGKLICGAKKRGKRHGQGEPCQVAPVRGGTRCGKHGGKSPKATEAAETRIMEAEATQILGRIDPDGEKKHPVEHLLKLINQKAAEVAWLRAKVQALTEEELTWGLTKHDEGQEKGQPTDLKTMESTPNIWWVQLRSAEEQLAKWAAAATRAGVEERQIRLAEGRGELIVGAIQQILTGLNLDPTQQELVPDLVQVAFRQLSGEGS